MIRLIATDMDGTLLDSNNQLPKDFYETLSTLQKENIRFVIASGRPYKTLYNNFKPYSDQMYFICDNGAYIARPNEAPVISVIDKSLVNDIVSICEQIPGIYLLLCGIKHFYHKPLPEQYMDNIKCYYTDQKSLTDLHDIDDDIFKIAIYDPAGSKDHCYPVLQEHFGELLNVVVSGAQWLDINNKGINKGMALNEIQQEYAITKEETMAFGDFYNDVEMLKEAHFSFIMANANEDMKQYGNFIAKSNDENGVMDAIQEYVLTPLSR